MVLEAAEVGVSKAEVVAAGVGSVVVVAVVAVEVGEVEEEGVAAGEVEVEVAGEAVLEAGEPEVPAALALILVAPSLVVVSLPSTCLATVLCAMRPRSARPSPRL